MASPQNKTRYEVVTQTADDGVLVPVPMVLLKELGWKEGDKIIFIKDDQGRYILRKTG